MKWLLIFAILLSTVSISRAAEATLGTTRSAAGSVSERIAQLATQAREHYDRARAAQRSDDWATYGAEMRRLGEVLRQLEATRPRP